ncbi:hypothetical protein Agub_g5811 [Astrephomene gubernaculifera]|uniref:Uncharacterized protein n=1 Tax=Astrephomene gubernaculifera TaxID=47775 RepID=A0AAD3HLA9_9CHLO|nr:hypothetical protein Agub_g5811 [Astrephomene gubernaculifera]
MISAKDARSPVGQKLINDLMMDEEEELNTVIVYEDAEAGDADAPLPPGRKQRTPPRSSVPPRPPRRPPTTAPSTSPNRTVASALSPSLTTRSRTPRHGSSDSPSPGRPATAPAPASTSMLLPPQLPAARGPKDPRAPAVSPLLERHLVSRHASAYLGTVTAVLHRVSSPAATGVPRDTQRRPGTVPHDVYQHSALSPPPRRTSPSLSSSAPGASVGASVVTAISDMASLRSPAGTLGGVSGLDGVDPSPVLLHPSSLALGPLEPVSFGVAPHAHPAYGGSAGGGSRGSAVGAGGMGSIGGSAGSGVAGGGHVPYLDRAYASVAPLACTVDALARRAEAHKALTRQRMLQKQQNEQLREHIQEKHQNLQQQSQPQQQQSQQQHQLQHPRSPVQGGGGASDKDGPVGPGHVALFQPRSNEPYQIRWEGGMQPIALGLAWDASPGMVAAAAAAAASAAASVAARAEGKRSLSFSACASPSLDGAPLSPLRSPGRSGMPAGEVAGPATGSPSEDPASPASRSGGEGKGAPSSRGVTGTGASTGAVSAADSSPPASWATDLSGTRKLRGAAPAWVAGVPQSHGAASGAAGGGGSPPRSSPARKVRFPHPRTGSSTTAAEAVAAAAGAVAAVRAHLPPAVRRGYRGQLAAQTIRDWETITEPNRRMMQQIEVVTNLVGTSHSSLTVSPATHGKGTSRSGGAAQQRGRGSRQPGSPQQRLRSQKAQEQQQQQQGVEGSTHSGSQASGGSYGQHTSARSKRRYIRYSSDIFPELGLPPRTGLAPGQVPPGGQSASSSARGGAGGSGADGSPRPAAGEGEEGAATESEASIGPSAADSYTYYPGAEYSTEYAEGEIVYRTPSSMRGPRYLSSVTSNRRLPTPTAAVAAVLASGSAAASAVASLPHWLDPLTAVATTPFAAMGSPRHEESASAASTTGFAAFPVLNASAGSLSAPRPPSRSSSLGPVLSLASLGARGVGLHGHPTGPPPTPASHDLPDEPTAWSLGGSALGPGSFGLPNGYVFGYGPGQVPLPARRSEDLHLETSFGSGVPPIPLGSPYQSSGGAVGHSAYSVRGVSSGSGTAEVDGDSTARRQSAGSDLMRRSSSLGPRRPGSHSYESSSAGGGTGSDALRSVDSVGGAAVGQQSDRRGGVAVAGSSGGVADMGGGADISDLGLGMPHIQRTSSRLSQGAQAALGALLEDVGLGGGEVAAAGGEVASPGSGSRRSVPRVLSASRALEVSGSRPPSGRLSASRSRASQSSSSAAGAGGGLGSSSLGGSRQDVAADAAAATGATAGEVLAAAAGEEAVEAAVVGKGAGYITAVGEEYEGEDVDGDEGLYDEDAAVAEDAAAVDEADGVDDDDAEDEASGAMPPRYSSSPPVPQGPVLTPGAGYRVVTSVAAGLVSEDPREVARMAQQRELEAQLERSADHELKLRPPPALPRRSRAPARSPGLPPCLPYSSSSSSRLRATASCGCCSRAPPCRLPAAPSAWWRRPCPHPRRWRRSRRPPGRCWEHRRLVAPHPTSSTSRRHPRAPDATRLRTRLSPPHNPPPSSTPASSSHPTGAPPHRPERRAGAPTCTCRRPPTRAGPCRCRTCGLRKGARCCAVQGG